MSAVTEDMLRAYADSDGLGLAALVRKGELTPIELEETAVATIEKLNPQLNAVIRKLYEMGRSADAACRAGHDRTFPVQHSHRLLLGRPREHQVT